MRRSHLTLVLLLSTLGLVGLGAATTAAPELLGQPKEVLAQAPKKDAEPATKSGKEEVKKAVAKEKVSEEPKVEEKKEVVKEEVKKEEPKVKEAPKAKEEPKVAVKEEPKPEVKDAPKAKEDVKEEAKESAKEEEKKEEEAKSDPIEELKKAVAAADTKAGDGIKRGDNAWLLVSSAFVLLMTPGLALFYGGMVRKKNVLATMMQSYAAMAIVGIYWVAVGYGLAFGPSIIKISALGVEDGGILGWDSKLFFLKGINPADYLPGYNIPVYTHVMFQGMFAIITPALISGAIAERIRFWPWTIFMILWVTIVYCPLAHMVWAWDWFYFDPATAGKDVGGTAIGFLGKLGALDFAGGTVVHIAAGFAGLACIFVLSKRTGYPQHAMHPNSMVLTLIGAGLLWMGWFGFNGGSALNSSDLGTTGFATTQAAAAAAAVTWCLVEWLFKGKPTALGLASGVVAGLVAVTPASGYVYPWGGAAIGAIASVVCYFAVQLKSMLGYDDSLDAFGVHGVGGFVGAVLTGVFCYAAVQSASADGMLAHMGLEKQKASLVAEADKLKKEIPAIEKTEPEMKKKLDEAEAALAKAKTDDEKETLQKDVDTAKAEFEEVAKKVTRRKDRIDAIEKAKDEKVADDKGGEIVQLEDKIAAYKKDGKGPFTQLIIQIKASVISAVFAFALSFGLALLVQAITLGGFRTSVKDENEGLDQTEHGETGFDFSAVDMVASLSSEPKAAKVPPGQKRFEVVLEGIDNGELMKAWSALCQPSEQPLDPDFKLIYPYVTTVSGSRFRLRGGDPAKLSASIQKLFSKKLGKQLKARVEE